MTASSLEDQTYSITVAAATYTVPAFTSSVSSTICGNWVYTITQSDGSTALDSSVFTSVTPATPRVTVYTTDEAKVATYAVLVKGYQGTYTGHTTTMTFNVIVNIDCSLNTITTTS